MTQPAPAERAEEEGAHGADAIDVEALEAAGIAAAFGTPVYVYDLDVVARRAAALRVALPQVVDLAYAAKANPSLAVLSRLASLGLGGDVASRGELAAVLRAGFDPARVVVTGPGKAEDLHRAAVRAGVLAVTVESPGELARLERIAADEGRVAPVLLRASATDEAAAERDRIIGDAGAGKFGMDVDDLRAAARHAVASPHLDLLGLHRFVASNVTDAGALAAHAAATVALARDVVEGAGVLLRLVDLGGGLGIPYADDEPALDVADLGDRLTALAGGWAGDPAMAGARLLLEPGRYLVGPAGAWLACVVDRKRVDGAEVAVLDGGINHLLRPALIGREHRVRLVGTGGAGRESEEGSAGRPVFPAAVSAPGPVSIVGPLCTGLDVLASRARIPAPAVGDLVAVLDAGAYGFTESMPLFLSHATPAEVVMEDGHPRLARPRIEPEEWLDRQIA